MIRSEKEVKVRLERYIDEKKKVTAQRSWESGYLLGIIDTLRWVMGNNK